MFAAEDIPYRETGSFSPIVLDYLEGSEKLFSFYSFPPTAAGIEAAIEQKKAQPLDRPLLAAVLSDQYSTLAAEARVLQNVASLESPNTFSICTAHQPNLFTGPLYFIYKIIHAIKLADHLNSQFNELHFVPVYYMGSEDADLEELNHTYVGGKKYEWTTMQTGAVGRMSIDRQLAALIDDLEGQMGVAPHGRDFIKLLRESFQPGATVQDATFRLVNALFGRFGLLVLLPDDARLKEKMIPVFEQDLFQSLPSGIVEKTSAQLSQLYNAQAYPREINLFYLEGSVRERIEMRDGRFHVHNTTLSFSPDEMRAELHGHPSRFSPNVILRGLFQETILPNVAFIGGGGEVAYWLQLKELFDHYQVVFPPLVLRNSFLVVPSRSQEILSKLKLGLPRLFCTPNDILNGIIEAEGSTPKLNGEIESLKGWYGALREKACGVDSSLAAHVSALEAGALKKLAALQTKMQRAERRKRSVVRQQITAMKEGLFPRQSLQERVENVAQFYAAWGPGFIDALYHHSPPLNQHFTVLHELKTGQS